MHRRSFASWVVLVPLLLGAGLATAEAPPATAVDLGVTRWPIIRRESGPVNYYEVMRENGTAFVRSHYRPSFSTAVLGTEMRGADKQAAQTVRWRWRAQILPVGGDECAHGREDSAAVVYLTWKRGLKWYTLKYVWSAVGRLGAVCDRKRNLFVGQDTTILQTGGPTGVWQDEAVDLKTEFRRHFENGNPNASVPDFVGIGIMSDGDQTKSESSADFADFVLGR
ncbi:MAG: DUF3047 domain-containing protein [Polyangiaceae bacterium]|nr:DUF3047 domain-containing protein [Polyangiaceae bacterium]